MSAFELQDFKRENQMSLKGLTTILGLWVLLTGFRILKDT